MNDADNLMRKKIFKNSYFHLTLIIMLFIISFLTIVNTK